MCDSEIIPSIGRCTLYNIHKDLYINNLYRLSRIFLRVCQAEKPRIAGYVRFFCLVHPEEKTSRMYK